MNKAIFLVAGSGSRLSPITDNLPKCLVEINGKKILDNSLEILLLKGITDVVMVTGFCREVLLKHIQTKWVDHFNFEFIENRDYDSNNNIYSFWLAKDHFDEPFLLLEGDVLIEPSILLDFNFQQETSCWFGSPFTAEHDGCRLTASDDEQITKIEIIREKTNPSPNYFKSVGILYYNGNGALLREHLDAEIQDGNINIYFDLFFAKYLNDFPLRVENIKDKVWMEIDDHNDLALAEKKFIDL